MRRHSYRPLWAVKCISDDDDEDQKRVYQQLNGKANMMLNLMLMKVNDFGVISGIAKYIIGRMLNG